MNSSKISIVISLLAIMISLSTPFTQNFLAEERSESELAVIDCELDVVSVTDVASFGTGGPSSIADRSTRYLMANVTFVNQANSKFPLKVIDSQIVYNGKSQVLPIGKAQHNTTVFSSETGNIKFFTPLTFTGDFQAELNRVTVAAVFVGIDLTFTGDFQAELNIWYYDPTSKKVKLFQEDIYEIQSNGTDVKVHPIQEYVYQKEDVMARYMA